jgi:diketogulonate reductase-like aldo/keto reductase
VLGQGTWNMAVQPERYREEIEALRMGVDLGLTLIDTAEMYAGGRAETLVGEALADRRDELFLVSKVLPQHSSRPGTVSSCEASLRRLKTDRLDLYLLHWRGAVPLGETLEAFDTLRRQGKIRYWGVSNFDIDDLEEAVSMRRADELPMATNQVLYNLLRRGIEFDLLPWCRAHGMPVMAYSPLDQGRLLGNRTLTEVAHRLRATPAQVALAWLLRHDGIVAIPKSASVERVRENRGALDLELDAEDLVRLEAAFPSPRRKVPLEML